jgi:iron complex outermembrane recepter protein
MASYFMRLNLISASVLLSSATVFAQTSVESSNSDEATILEEIVVTAQRREQPLEKLPISVTVLDAETITQQNIQAVDDFLVRAPNTSFSSDGTPATFNLSMRGVTNIGGISNVVGVYVDEFNVAPSTSSIGFNQAVLDVERIEVLRGPQGTFFGRNTTAGAISITSVKPVQTSEGRISFEAANFDTYEAKGFVNVPLSDIAAIRVSGQYENAGGFLRNEFAPSINNSQENYAARTALRFTPSDRWTIDVAGTYTHFSQDYPDIVPTGQPNDTFQLLDLPIFPPEAGVFPENERTIAVNRPAREDADQFIANSRIAYEADAFEVIGVLGYINSKLDRTGELDNTGLDFYFIEEDIGQLKSFSSELRVQSTSKSGLTWMGGVIYAKDELSGRFAQRFGPDWADFLGGFGIDPADVPFETFIFSQSDTNDSDTIAGFAEVGFVGERFTASLSSRLSFDDIEQSESNFDVAAVPTFNDDGSFFFPVSQSGPDFGRAEFTQILPRASLTYELSDAANLYGVVSKGGKPGGFNFGSLNAPGISPTFDKETLLNYEIGSKGRGFDNRLRYSAAVFYMDWSDIQIASDFIDPITLGDVSSTINYPNARSYGFELEFGATLAYGLKFEAGVGMNESEFGSGPEVTVSAFGTQGSIRGNRLPLSPKWTGNAALQYDFALLRNQAYLRAEYVYQGSRFGALRNTTLANVVSADELAANPGLNRDTLVGEFIPKYNTINLRAGVEIGSFNIDAYAENLTNENYLTGYLAGDSLSGIGAVVNPTRYGVNVGFRF